MDPNRLVWPVISGLALIYLILVIAAGDPTEPFYRGR